MNFYSDLLFLFLSEARANELLDFVSEEFRDDPQRAKGTRHQAIFGLDFQTWQDLVSVFNITDPMIPDRSQAYAESERLNANGWYRS